MKEEAESASTQDHLNPSPLFSPHQHLFVASHISVAEFLIHSLGSDCVAVVILLLIPR